MKTIVLGDLHFGMKGFSDNFFDNQLKFFTEQLFPYMKENDITSIIQLGDWLDNRKSMDIKFFNRIVNEFLEPIKKHGFKFTTFLGNHDIYYNSTLDVNLVKYFQDLYPDNITVHSTREKREFGDSIYMFVPWVTDDGVRLSELRGVDVLFGHFEIKNFEMVKGHKDEKSSLSTDYFKKAPNLKRVVSGHYHVQGNDGFVMYAGTPYQLNWGDYETSRGFFIFDGADYDYVENTESAKYVKIKYDSEAEKIIEISGLEFDSIWLDNISELKTLGIDLSKHNVKFFINNAETKEYESDIFNLNQQGVHFDVINNVEISDLIGTDYNGEIDNISGTELIIRSVKENKPHLVTVLNEILQEIG